MNETNYTSFQIKPKIEEHIWEGRRCVFRNDAFSLDDVFFVSAVGTLDGMNYYSFDVELNDTPENKKLSYQFATKSEALRSQRELCRAYTKTQEFANERDDVDK